MSEQLPFHMKVYVDTTDYIRDRLPPNWQEINNSRPGHPLGDLEARLLLLPQVVNAEAGHLNYVCFEPSAEGFDAAKAEFDEIEQKIRSVIDGWLRDLKANRYSVQQQVDGTHAIFCNGGFIGGGYQSWDRDTAVEAAREMIEGDKEAGVPVIEEVA